ncbi:MAG TPA: hypothetical protein DHW34_00755 [Actinobacteria bacterium]|nr:hypothetical protein [Actinomycetota bacterium]
MTATTARHPHRLGRLAATVLSTAVVALGLSVVAAASPAQASTLTLPYLCTFNAPNLAASYDLGISNYPVTITAPDSVNAGNSITASYSFPSVPANLPFAIPDAQVRAEPTVSVRLQGGSALFAVTTTSGSPSSTGTIAAYSSITAPQPVSISIPTTTASGATQNFEPGAKIELVPGTFTYVVVATSDSDLSGSTVTCTPQSTTTAGSKTFVNGVPPANPTSQCVAQAGDTTGGSGCATQQVAYVSILQGNLTQRTYTNTTATTGSTDGSALGSPVQGTSNVNPNATTVNLGTVTSPLAPASIVGNLNDITVSDNRGGTSGWSLSAVLTNFTGSTGKSMNKSTLTATPTCAAATVGEAYDYTAPGKTAISGFDASLVAPGAAAGSSAQSFSGTVALCTKDGQQNSTTDTTGGVYTVRSLVTLTVPAFQAADRYVATMTITLA